MKNTLLGMISLLLFAVAPAFATGLSDGNTPDLSKPGVRPLTTASPFSRQAKGKNIGLGVRLGDPSGISFKKYFGNNALEINLGRTHVWGWKGRYDDMYKGLYGKDWKYENYFPLAIQVHYLKHKDFGKVSGLQWYWGIGGQFRYSNYYIRYGKDGDERMAYTNMDLGLDGILGLEYTMSEIPLSFALEGNLFLEVADNPFWIWGQSGLAVRYNF